MKGFLTATLATLILAAAPAASAQSDAEIAERLEQAAEVVGELVNAPDSDIPMDLINDAECIAVIPGLKKAALGIGGEYGRGAVSCRNDQGAWGAPSMVALFAGSFGFQIGGSSTDVVMLFMNSDGVEHLIRNEFTLGGDATVAAGPKGRSARAATDVTFQAEILSYSRSQGAFAGVSLEGTSFQQDHDANEALYGRSVEPSAILVDGAVSPPAAAAPLLHALASAD
jgi:lipid-binding SYLF domain-containing protein